MAWTIIGIICILLLVYLILREFNCWYWKTNKKISLLEKQNELLEALVKKVCGKLPKEKISDEEIYEPGYVPGHDNVKKTTSDGDDKILL